MTDTRSSRLLEKSGTGNLVRYFVKKNIKCPPCQMRVPQKAYQGWPLLDPGAARHAAFRAWPRVQRPNAAPGFRAAPCGCAAGATFSAARGKKVVLVNVMERARRPERSSGICAKRRSGRKRESCDKRLSRPRSDSLIHNSSCTRPDGRPQNRLGLPPRLYNRKGHSVQT